MHWIDNPYVVPLLIASSASIALALFAWRHRRSPGATPLAVLTLAIALWQVSYAFELSSGSRSATILWAKVGYIGIVMVPTSWLAVSLQYTGRGKWLNRRNIALLTIVPLTTLLLAWTNEGHKLIWSEIGPGSPGSFSATEFFHGTWFWIFAGYSYLQLILGIVFLAGALLNAPRLFWQQGVALLVSALVPWITNWSFIVGLTPTDHIDLTAFAFLGNGITIAWAIAKTRLFDIAPVARETVFRRMSERVLVLDAKNNVADFNPAAQRILGGSTVLTVGRPVGQVWPDATERHQLDSESGPEHIEVQFGEGDEQATYDVAVSSIYDARAQVAGRIILFHDTTEFKRQEAKLREAARLVSIGELAAGVAHEINSPLTVIAGTSEMLQDEDLPPAVEARLRTIESHANRAGKIVRNLLSFARRQEPKKEYVDVIPILKQAIELKSHDFLLNNIRVTRRWPAEIPSTLLDSHQLTQVMVNIFTNAEQAMVEAHGGGELVISVDQQKDKIRISVSDDGLGILPENMPKIFDPFFTTKDVGEGTGLGLSTCYGILRQHDGQIIAESVPGNGATFHIELPILSSNGGLESTAPATVSRQTGSLNVLVVDDEPDILELISDALSSEWCTVDSPERGKEALELMRTVEYDCIILDLKMPDMSGQQLYQLIEESGTDMARKVIFMTGDLLSPDTHDFLANTGNRSLSKPFNMSDLRDLSHTTPGST